MDPPPKLDSGFRANHHGWIALLLAVAPIFIAFAMIGMQPRGWGSDWFSIALGFLAIGSLLLSGPYGIYVAIVGRKNPNQLFLALLASFIGFTACGIFIGSAHSGLREDEQMTQPRLLIAANELRNKQALKASETPENRQ